MNNPIPQYSGPIAVLDMLGFKKFISDNSLENVISSYAHIITSSTFTAEVLQENLEFMVYSDTIAIRLVNLSGKGFINFIKALQFIIHNYYYTNQVPGFNSMPLRGAISCGQYSWYNGDISTQILNRNPIIAKKVNFIVGQAIIDAHDHEHLQDWIGISMDNKTFISLQKRFPNAISYLIESNELVEYNIPIKKNKNIQGYVVNPTQWAVFEGCFTAFVDKCENVIHDESEIIDVKMKYYNSLLFLNHLHANDKLLPRFNGEIKSSIPPLKIDKTKYYQLQNHIEQLLNTARTHNNG